jgi:hypothetical protein
MGALNRQPRAALRPARLQNRPAGPGLHPSSEPVLPLSAAIVGLKSPLRHCLPLFVLVAQKVRISWSRNCGGERRCCGSIRDTRFCTSMASFKLFSRAVAIRLDGSWIGLRRMAESRASSREGAGCGTSPRPCRLSKAVTLGRRQLTCPQMWIKLLTDARSPSSNPQFVPNAGARRA